MAREAHAIEEAARRRLYGHFMQAPFPIAVLRGPHHVTELANPIALQAWGKDQSDARTSPSSRACPSSRASRSSAIWTRCIAPGSRTRRAASWLGWRERSDGALEDVYWDFVYAPLRDADGASTAVLVCGFEVTAQVRAAQELARLLATAEASERQFRELVENLPELAWTARPDGFIDYYNRRWYDYTGTTAEQMQGWGWKSVHDPAHARRRRSSAGSTRSRRASRSRWSSRSGARTAAFRWFLTRVEPLHDADGRIVRWFGSNTDIDERRRNDDFREMFLGILGPRPSQSAEHDPHDVARAVDAHDTPAEIRKKLERVTSSGVRMQRMIEQLLDLTRARLTAGIPVTLSAERSRSCRPRHQDRRRGSRRPSEVAMFELSVEGECAARVDADRFEQVVSNLLGNAVTHGDMTKPIRIVLDVANQPTVT